jgi:general secretion pathway protein N
MMLRTKIVLKIVLLAGSMLGAWAMAATPPVAGPPRDDGVGLRRTAVGAETTSPTPVAANKANNANNNVERTLGGNPLWAVPLRQLSATRERPLFAPTRRPPPPVVKYQLASAPPPPPPRPAEPEKPPLQLLGTVAGGLEAMGVFVDLSTRAPLRLKTGEAHEGWVLKNVRRRDITLMKGGQVVVLALPAPEIKAASAPSGMEPQQSNPARRGNRAGRDDSFTATAASQADSVQAVVGQAGGTQDNGAKANAPAVLYNPPPVVFPQIQPAAALANPFQVPIPRR